MFGLARRLAKESAAKGTRFTASALYRSLLLEASSYGRRISVSEHSYTTKSNGIASIEDVAKIILRENTSVLVMTGAGISTASGIPDFRSPGTGLYSNLQKYNLPYPEAIFDINYFANDPQPFFALARELYPGERYRPNAAHHFLRLLQDKGKLRRAYTQNIDGLERLSGVSGELLIEAHGSFSTASCIMCKKEHDTEAVKRAILDHLPPVHCATPNCSGLVKPDIVFFGEMLPQSFWQFEQDLQSLDLLLIMGTSLEVFPFASIAESAEYDTARVLLNNAPAGSIGNRGGDLWLNGDIVNTVHQLGGACGWGDELINIIRQDTE